MPPAVLGSVLLASGVTAAGAVAGGVIQSRASNKATKASQQANTEALNFTKSQAEAAAADYERRYSTWLAERQALLSRLGISIPSPAAAPAASPGGAPAASPAVGARARLGQAFPMAAPRGATVADLMGMAGREARPEWNDWSGYGLQPA